ncbi:ATP-binding protein [Nocardioides houyundeii]|uniref:ATP-binding protein n=1 Tax=Nocardioides houyundeii TaxID=2045452 RepID=UPI0013155862|nr:ATP-binding protein [Nocardioides houyundeii]
MNRRRPMGLALLLVLFAVVGYYVLWVQPNQARVVEAFPVGLIAGIFVCTRRRAWPVMAVLVLALSTGLYMANGRELLVALAWSVGACAGAWVAATAVTRGGTHRPALLTERDLTYFITGGFLAALLSALLITAFSEPLQVSTPEVVFPAVFLPHFASYLVLLPHFMGRPRFPGVAPLSERILQWVLTVLYTLVAFSPLDLGPSIAFAIIPFLGWSALRAPMRETIVQLMVVGTIAHSMTIQGLGPFATDADTTSTRSELLGAGVGFFVIACALTAIPFALAVGVQRRESWQARREQAKVQQLVQSASGIAIIGTDRTGHIDMFNPGAQSVLGYCAEEVIGRQPSMFHSQAEIERLAAKLGIQPRFDLVALELANPKYAGFDVEFIRKDGSVRTLQLSISRMVDASGRAIGFVGTGEDVTRRVQQARALEDALAAERLAVENLREIDQVKDAFVSGVSHELRTPITSILGYLEMLEEGGFGPMQQGQVQALGRVKGNSRRLLSLIDDLLTLSRIQDGSLAVATCQLDLRDVVTGAHEEMAPGLQAAGIEFSCTVPDEEVFVVGDEERLGRVLVNLLGNAAKFTDRLGKVDLTLSVEGGTAVVAVRDTGIGIPSCDQTKLFDRFFRSSVAHERAIQGSGLGLSIARAIVETHGGRIDVESGEGVGSTFRVRLPLEGQEPVGVQDQLAVLGESTYDDEPGDVLAS